ncbi:cation:dicarboxylate symporter family transporter [Candidatus Mesenet endosymbiont of Agriotes lineatus]|uniref:cation:dicarboxylate symporter family transporter n=1 Tax=Candidatus Mesenet endosymbiont of Agriotes lineatus TaxID=3077948 RepID=UPI0030D420AD
MLKLLILVLIALLALFSNFIPTQIQALLYSISLSIKSILIFVIPFIVFTLTLSSSSNLKTNTFKFIILLLFTVCLSNLLSSLLAYFAGYIILKDTSVIPNIAQVKDDLSPLWHFKLPTMISNFQALFLGFVFGVILSYASPEKGKIIGDQLLKGALFFLKRVLSPIIPIFILGFVLKLLHDQVLSTMFNSYFISLIITTFVTYFYVFLLYGTANSFKIKDWLMSINNMLPAFITAITTMSSSAAMPMTLVGSEKNTKERDIIFSVIPATVSIHLIGDCFFIIILTLVIISSFNEHSLNIADHAVFLFFFLLSKFAIAAVPGGGIIVMLPVLEQYLKFSPAMLSLITTLYMLLDPIITSANVMGNGAFAMLFTKLYKKLKK